MYNAHGVRGALDVVASKLSLMYLPYEERIKRDRTQIRGFFRLIKRRSYSQMIEVLKNAFRVFFGCSECILSYDIYDLHFFMTFNLHFSIRFLL